VRLKVRDQYMEASVQEKRYIWSYYNFTIIDERNQQRSFINLVPYET
jgi:hypothetical protein